MRDQLVMKAELEGITADFTTTINALTAQVVTLSTRVNNNANNNKLKETIRTGRKTY